MKVSIITVVYNGAATIASAVDSVVAQDHSDIEYIVIDGGSKDNTVEIVQSYGDKIAVLVSEKDKGIYDAMNKGLARATGDVIGILNSDDFYIDTDVISSVVAELNRTGKDSLIGDLIFVTPENLDHVVRFYSSEGFTLRKFEHGDMPPHPTFFVRREIYQRLGNFDTQYRITSDFDLMLRFLYKAKISWSYLPKVMVTMRTGGLTNQGIKSKIKLNREIIASMRNNGLPSGTFKVYSKYFSKVFQLLKRPKTKIRQSKS
jgi:glycosyltransferase involved in cell wall biosynthesis